MITEAKLIDREIRAEFFKRAQEVEHVILFTSLRYPGTFALNRKGPFGIWKVNRRDVTPNG